MASCPFLLRARARLLGLIAVTLTIGACGQIGPLYLPEDAAEPPATEASEDEQKQQESP